MLVTDRLSVARALFRRRLGPGRGFTVPFFVRPRIDLALKESPARIRGTVGSALENAASFCRDKLPALAPGSATRASARDNRAVWPAHAALSLPRRLQGP